MEIRLTAPILPTVLKQEDPLKFPLTILTLATVLCTGCSMLTPSLPVADRMSAIDVERIEPVTHASGRDGASLRVISLNLAHGRKDSFSQLFVSEEQIRSNLADVVKFLQRENADVVTLQEADSPSWWSGNFDHVEFLAREAGYPWFTHANHVDNLFGTYGTAVLSRYPIRNGYRVDFNPTPPTTRKGFTLAEIEWTVGADDPVQLVDVVSVHLDFASRSRRIEQIRDMKAVLGERDRPTIVLGDFNSEWNDGEQEIQSLAKVKKLQTHRPEANYLYTYADSRLDWILISRHFEFCQYHAPADILSDHLAVFSEIVARHEHHHPPACKSA